MERNKRYDELNEAIKKVAEIATDMGLRVRVEVSSLIEYKSNSTERVSDLLSTFPSLIKRSTESPLTPSQGD